MMGLACESCETAFVVTSVPTLRIVYGRDKDWVLHRNAHEAIVALVLPSHADKDDDSHKDAQATRADRQKKAASSGRSIV